jgi:hypothetical protein
MRDSNALRYEPVALREEMAAFGYVFLRGLLTEAVPAATSMVTSILRDAGWCGGSAGDPLLATPAGIIAAAALSTSRSVQREVFRLEVLHQLVHHHALLTVMGELLDSPEVLRHPRPVPRMVFPSDRGDGATPSHQDHLGMQGSTNALTAWIVMQHCALEDGPLAVAEASHLGGLRPNKPLSGARVFACEDADLNGHWRSADFEPGDVVIFHSLTVHRALPNHSPYVRLSVDSRYQRAQEPICEVALRDEVDLSWDEVYRGWGPSELPRYWERQAQMVTPFDPQYYLRQPPTG